MSLPFPVSRFLFPVSCNFRAACGLFAAGLLLSCGTTEEPSVDETVTMAASVESEPLIGDGDIPSRPPVAMSWGMTDGSHVAGKFDPFRVTLRNERMEKVEVALSMVGTGLDQRMVKVDVGTFHLKDLESHQIDIPIESLPIQSVGAPAQIELTATCSGAGCSSCLPNECMSSSLRTSPKSMRRRRAHGHLWHWACREGTCRARRSRRCSRIP